MDHKPRKPYLAAYNALKVLGVPMFTNEDNDRLGNFCISAEEPHSHEWVNYYAEASDWVFGVNPALESVLKRYGLFAEWINPGCLGVYRV
jgi:hypothetical protein